MAFVYFAQKSYFFRDQLLHCIQQYLNVKGLCNMGVHSGTHGFFLVFVKGIGSHGNDRNPGFGTCHFTDDPGGFIAVFIWHLDIHQDQIIMICWLCFQHIDADLAILCPFHLEAMFLQKGDDDFCIQIIVFCQKNPSAFESCFFSFCWLML